MEESAWPLVSTEMHKTELNGTEQNGTAQNRTRQYSLGQNRTGQDRTGQNMTAQRSLTFNNLNRKLDLKKRSPVSIGIADRDKQALWG